MIECLERCRCKIILAWTLLGLAFVADAQNIGSMTQISKITIHSTILNEERQIAIYKPPSLPEFPSNIPPVIYVLDGEFLTDLVRAHAGYFTELWKELPPITVVGIENKKGMSNRTRDLTPSKSKLNNGGGAEDFVRFIKEELMPLMEKDYKTRPYRVLMGASSGGLFTIHTLLNHSSLFDAYLASSPTLAWNNSKIMDSLEEKLNIAPQTGKTLFFCVGNESGLYLPNALKLDSLLREKSSPNIRYQFKHYPGETHGTTPMKSYYDGFKFIFKVGPEDLDIQIQDITYDTIEKYYADWSSIFGFPMKPRETVINSYGYRFLREFNQIDKALEFFEMNVRNYPASANVYDSYAEALLMKGDKQSSLINYEKAFKLDPANKHAQQQIARLKNELNK